MKRRSNQLKLMVALAVLAIALIPSVSRSRATGSAEFDSEIQKVEAFAKDVGKFQDRSVLLSKKPSRTTEETNSLIKDRDSLRGRLAGVEGAFRTIEAKYKADGRWVNLDAEVLKLITDAKARQVIERGGGARKIIEDAQNLTGSASEIAGVGHDVFGESSESGMRIISAAYHPSPFFFKHAIGCKIAGAIVAAKGANASHNQNTRAYCLCVEMQSLDETLSQCEAANP